mmetsp:Transcript_68759/g.114860  ORF Transcript_68759/g.114860 Transcript_68759/m.114860 type:complete len:108 (+) Transcript_68759:87-410(+)
MGWLQIFGSILFVADPLPWMLTVISLFRHTVTFFGHGQRFSERGEGLIAITCLGHYLHMLGAAVAPGIFFQSVCLAAVGYSDKSVAHQHPEKTQAVAVARPQHPEQE